MYSFKHSELRGSDWKSTVRALNDFRPLPDCWAGMACTTSMQESLGIMGLSAEVHNQYIHKHLMTCSTSLYASCLELWDCLQRFKHQLIACSTSLYARVSGKCCIVCRGSLLVHSQAPSHDMFYMYARIAWNYGIVCRGSLSVHSQASSHA
jgi:hypothetical protein